MVVEGRIYAGWYQILLTDDPSRCFADGDNWTDALVERGYAGDLRSRVFSTHADLNDHWVELERADAAPSPADYDGIVSFDFDCMTGGAHLMSVSDDIPTLSLEVPPGTYLVYACCKNPGIDVDALGEGGDLSDLELRDRQDLERYRVVLVAREA